MLTQNEYFDGKVKSIGFEGSEGKATVGVMEAGEYEFGTSTHEIMKVISGALTVVLPGATAETVFHAGETFEVEAGKSFQVKTSEATSYLCLYGE
ncbi:pyrimidine/purine nucleoside phosphorylase [Kiritimatiellota bacterium B12222]|nr:pyrimidine/purine nucleoside phosphorylase [Kiritimatiellota bacterium B12222]